MCGQFELPEMEMDGMLRILSARYGDAAIASCRKAGTARPGEILPVLARGKNGDIGAFLMRWGYQMDEKKQLLINARSETAAKKPIFADSWRQRRCLIPAACYYEWQRSGGKEKQKFALAPADASDFYLAGLYRYEQNRKIPSFVVLTRSAAQDIAFIHHRMPVLLPKRAAEKWISQETDAQMILSHALTILDASNCPENLDFPGDGLEF